MFDNWIPSEPQLTQNRRTYQPYSSKQSFLWLSGMYNLSILNIDSFQAVEVQNLWEIKGEQSFAQAAAASEDFAKIAGLGFWNHAATLHICLRNSSVKEVTTSKLMSEIAPSSTLV